jgi:cytochrome c peroxidase
VLLAIATLVPWTFAPASATTDTLSAHLPDVVTDADFYTDGAPNPEQVELGRMLMFDKILSGNRNISCATCHHPLAGTADGLSLSIGEGASGLADRRDTGVAEYAVTERVPRNAPALFNVGAREFDTLFHDGRVTADPSHPAGFQTPAGDLLPLGLDNALAAQALFPVTSGTEMAGQPSENEIADAADAADLRLVWRLLADRLRAVPAYVELFERVYGIGAEEITYVHAANAIAAFEAVTWRADDSPFDRFLRGDAGAMSEAALRGMELFYGDGRCSSCHSGAFQTDHAFHAIAMPQLGPGKGDGPSGREDHGRERVTGDANDRFAFRTPSLRNVALTAPYGHAGAYATLEGAVRHHLDPLTALFLYDPLQAILPARSDLDALDLIVHDDPELRADIAAANDLAPWGASEAQIAELLAFLAALTDPASLDLVSNVPESVPSGLPVVD